MTIGNSRHNPESQLLNFSLSLSLHRLKALHGRLDGLEAQLAAAERAAASSEAQRKGLLEEKNRFQKQAKVRLQEVVPGILFHVVGGCL